MTITIIKNNIRKYNLLMRQGIPIFVKFYSPTCGACIAMQQEWKKLLKDIKQYQGSVGIAEINIHNINKLNGYNQVHYVPTIALIQHGNLVKEYKQPRISNHMLSFLKRQHIIYRSQRTMRKKKRKKQKSRRNLNI